MGHFRSQLELAHRWFDSSGHASIGGRTVWVASKRLNLVSLQFGDFLAGGVAYSPTGFIDLFGDLHRLYSRVMK